MAVKAVVFDVGEVLVDETREYGTWADWLGVPRHTFSAVFGGVIASGRDYAGRAINARRALAYARMSAGWSHERWLAECRRIEESERKWTTGYPMSMGRPFRPSVARAYIAYWEPILSKYERAAVYPWLPLEPDPPRPEP